MTGRFPATVTPSLMRKLNNAHMARMEACDAECDGVGYCAAVWQTASQQEKRTEERKEVR